MNAGFHKFLWKTGSFAQESELVSWKFLGASDSEASVAGGKFAVRVVSKVEGEELAAEGFLVKRNGIFLVVGCSELSRSRHRHVITGKGLSDDDSIGVVLQFED